VTIGERIKQLREKRGLSQRALAKAIGVSQAIVQRWEGGARDPNQMAIANAKRLARCLGVSIDYLVGMYEDDDQGDGEPAGVVLVGA